MSCIQVAVWDVTSCSGGISAFRRIVLPPFSGSSDYILYSVCLGRGVTTVLAGLNPCDYYLWGLLKACVYSNKINGEELTKSRCRNCRASLQKRRTQN